MAGQTTNYLFDYPTSTDYVKDGATAIQTLATDVDTTLFTALGGAYPGLRLVKKQTIGNSVSSVTVTGAFSATYDNYLILVAGGTAASVGGINLRLGSTATGYYGALSFTTYSTSAVAGATDNNASVFTYFGNANTNNIVGNMFVNSPFLSKNTVVSSSWVGTSTISSSGHYAGFLNDTSSYTAFTILATGGAFTGGTIYVYGYGAS